MSQPKSLAWGALGVPEDPAETLAREACKTAETSCSGCGRYFRDDELDDDWNCPECASFLAEAIAASEMGATP